MKLNQAFSSVLLWSVVQTNAFSLQSTTFTSSGRTSARTGTKLYLNLGTNNDSKNDMNTNMNMNIPCTIRSACISLALSCTIFLSPLSLLEPQSAVAADYGSFTDEQKAVAEAWRIVDNNFYDRTFNDQDWFQIRQDAVIKKKYKNNQEARDAIDKIVSSLGDKYTRYLPPAKYRSIVDSATGTLAGVGVEISVDKDSGKIYVSDVEPSSPALMGTFNFE